MCGDCVSRATVPTASPAASPLPPTTSPLSSTTVSTPPVLTSFASPILFAASPTVLSSTLPMPQLSPTEPIPELQSTLPMPELSPTVSSTGSSIPIPNSPVSSNPQGDSTAQVYCQGLRHTNCQNSSTTETGRTSSSLRIWSHPCERGHSGTLTSRRTSIIIAIYAIADPLYELPEAEKATKAPKRSQVHLGRRSFANQLHAKGPTSWSCQTHYTLHSSTTLPPKTSQDLVCGCYVQGSARSLQTDVVYTCFYQTERINQTSPSSLRTHVKTLQG